MKKNVNGTNKMQLNTSELLRINDVRKDKNVGPCYKHNEVKCTTIAIKSQLCM